MAAMVAGCPLVASSVTAATLLSLRHVPASIAGTWDAFLAFLAIAAVNAALAAVIPAVAAARLLEGRAAVKIIVAVACGTAGLGVYTFACFALRTIITP